MSPHAYQATVDPYPEKMPDQGLTDCDFPDPLVLAWHDAEPHEGDGHWQLAHDFRFVCRVPGEMSLRTITAPRGMFTDLASVPRFLWDREGFGPYGPHLKASIIHDYLFMAWTDFRGFARHSDFAFANRVFYAGMQICGAPRRRAMYTAVKTFGWDMFCDNGEDPPFSERMNAWLKHLTDAEGRAGS